MTPVLCPLCGHTDACAREGDRCPADGRALVRAEEHDARPNDPYLGRVVGGYPLVALLRPSAVGPTYRALKEPGRREVAVKVLRPTGPIDPLAARLRKVMPLVCGLSHPAVVKPLDYGVEPDGLIFVVTEVVQGTTLADLVAGRRPVRPLRAAPVVAELLRALADAHAHGVVHGNLKPGNVVLVSTPEGAESVRLLELGIAEVLRPRDGVPSPGSETLGTPLYLAPELAKGQPASPLSDLYSTGAILYELLSGSPPFDRGDPIQTARAHVEAPIPQFAAGLGISPALDRIVCRALAKLPEDRFADAAAMAKALAQLQGPKAEGGGVDQRTTQPLTIEELERNTRPPEEPTASKVEAAAEEAEAPPAAATEEAAQPEGPLDPPTPPAAERPRVDRQVEEAPPELPPRRSKARLAVAVGGAVAGVGLLAAALVAIRSTPPDGSGSMLDLVRTVGSRGEVARLAIPGAYEEEPAPKPGQPPAPRRTVRREAPTAVDASVPEPPDAAAPAPAPEPPPAPDAATPEAVLAKVEKPDGSLLVSCTARCKVYVDGGLVGESPKAGIPLKEGEHHLRAVNPDTGVEREQTVKIKSAQRTRVTVEL